MNGPRDVVIRFEGGRRHRAFAQHVLGTASGTAYSLCGRHGRWWLGQQSDPGEPCWDCAATKASLVEGDS